ncbi:hypothetical protein LJC44_06350 [Parabacteroides sp. OttesenSCG-928-G06]|nr:hypothetical protein [Parabacteroides sp. OttesenSCG-928-G06]
MKRKLVGLVLGWMVATGALYAQEESFRFSGQLSGWGGYSPDRSAEVLFGARYIPQLNIEKAFKKERLLDGEVSAHLLGTADFYAMEDVLWQGRIKPYRLWMRYSTRQMEIRAGLQKINFGSAMMFRPLMWFDKMDPRDPLQMTDGVWGGLFRYYFLNNTNVWLWMLLGNDDPKGWELFPSDKQRPELGGRLQWPLAKGEMAMSYHFRQVDMVTYLPININKERRSEHRVGFDMKLNLAVGLWVEGSWIHNNEKMSPFANQTMLTVGTDYTLPVGNGLAVTFEQMVYDMGNKAFSFENTLTFSGLSFSYPVGIFDTLQYMAYYDWKQRGTYNFVNWQRQYNTWAFHLMGYWNPQADNASQIALGNNGFGGKGLQVMIVWNH